MASPVPHPRRSGKRLEVYARERGLWLPDAEQRAARRYLDALGHLEAGRTAAAVEVLRADARKESR